MQRFILIAALSAALAACSTAPETREVASVPQCKEAEPVVGSNIRRSRPCDKKDEQNSEAAQQRLRDLRDEQAAQIQATKAARPGQ